MDPKENFLEENLERGAKAHRNRAGSPARALAILWQELCPANHYLYNFQFACTCTHPNPGTTAPEDCLG